MTRKPIIFAVILARGGSKRLPGKNIRDFAGIPLIGWSIKAALDSGKIERVFVSTDDKTIAKVAVEQGAEVPFLRPTELALDETSSMDSLLHFLNDLKERPEYVMLMQPTSPLRTSEHVVQAVDLFSQEQKKGADSIVSVKHLKTPFKYLRFIEDGRMRTLKDSVEEQAGKVFLDCDLLGSNGALYLAALKTLEKEKTFYTQNTVPYIMDENSSIDIDTLEEFEQAEHIFKLTNS